MTSHQRAEARSGAEEPQDEGLPLRAWEAADAGAPRAAPWGGQSGRPQGRGNRA